MGSRWPFRCVGIKIYREKRSTSEMAWRVDDVDWVIGGAGQSGPAPLARGSFCFRLACQRNASRKATDTGKKKKKITLAGRTGIDLQSIIIA